MSDMPIENQIIDYCLKQELTKPGAKLKEILRLAWEAKFNGVKSEEIDHVLTLSSQLPDVKMVLGHTECGTCGYGSGGWASSPALKGRPVLTDQSRECPGCGAHFVGIENPYSGTTTIFSQED